MRHSFGPAQSSTSRWQRLCASVVERGRRMAVSAKKAGIACALWLLHVVCFNSIGLRVWGQLLKGRVEFFGTSHTIGDMVIIDYYLKRKRSHRSQVVSVFLVNKPHVANPYLARFEAQALGDARTIFVSNRFLCRLLTPLERRLFFAGPNTHFTQHPPEYHDLNHTYNFHLERKLPAAERQRARTLMETLGLPRDAAFVCVHAREAGFKAQFQPLGHNTYRDIDIATYLPAIEYLTRQGLWVIRMGESTVKPLPRMERVIDYARSLLKSDFLDVVLMAECEFLVGCNSGFSQLAHLFNKRALWTNSVPIEMCPWDDLVLWIPKLIWSKMERRCLTFPEVMDRGIGQFHHTQHYVAANLEAQANTPQDILEATQELHRWHQGDPGYSEEDRRYQRAFLQRIPRQYNAYGARANICASFIRQHRNLMPQVLEASEFLENGNGERERHGTVWPIEAAPVLGGSE